MGYAIVGHCPKCGAPVYAPDIWASTLPPPSTPSCNCNNTGTGNPPPKWSDNSSDSK